VGIRVYKPTSPGRRVSSVSDFSEITKSTPERSLVKRLQKHGGRNFQGFTTARFRGGGTKRLFRSIDFKRNKDGVAAKVVGVEYDPNRSARIALLHYLDGEKRYILWPEGLKVGAKVVSGEKVEPELGNCMTLENIPVGLIIHNVELYPGRGSQIGRSAGAAVTLMAREGAFALLQMKSGELRRVSIKCRATIGRVGNADHNLVRRGKAGRVRYLGRRPHQRGTAQNPVSHPLGGGEGRTGGGRHPCSPTGLLAKGYKTRQERKVSSKFIVRRRS
jgi:large subunit ribosomal protein L2